MNTKLLKKMGFVGAITCLGLVPIIIPNVLITSCSSAKNSPDNPQPYVPPGSNEIVVFNYTNYTETEQTTLVLNLGNINFD